MRAGESEVHPTSREGNELDRRFQRLRPARRGCERVRGAAGGDACARHPPPSARVGARRRRRERQRRHVASVRENPREITLAQSRAAVTSRRTLLAPPIHSLRTHSQSADATTSDLGTFTTVTIGEYGFGADLASATVKSHGRNFVIIF